MEPVADTMFSMIQHILCESPFQAHPAVLADNVKFPAFLNTVEKNFKMYGSFRSIQLVNILKSQLEAVDLVVDRSA